MIHDNFKFKTVLCVAVALVFLVGYLLLETYRLRAEVTTYQRHAEVYRQANDELLVSNKQLINAHKDLYKSFVSMKTSYTELKILFERCVGIQHVDVVNIGSGK